MYRPLFLGISNADPLVLYGFLIALTLSTIVVVGLILYFIGYYIIKLVRWARTTSMKNRQRKFDITK
jgi:hypothetical protein